MALVEELEELVRLQDPIRRGKRFETFLQAMLKEEGFHVTRNPACSPNLQVDLFARRGQINFLVEAKWLSRPVSTEHILTVTERVRRTPMDVFACVFSMSDYQAGAIRESCYHREREIVLFNGLEIRRIATGDLSFEQLLDDKRNVLRTHAESWFYDPIVEAHPPKRLRSCPDVFQFGDKTKTWHLSRKSAIESLFCNEYLEISGRYGGPVFSLHIHLGLRTVPELRRFMRMARRELDLANEGSFAIHQADAGWFGFGADNFITAIENRALRYAKLKWDHYHHSEELGYVDRIETGGLFGLSLRQSTSEGNSLHTGELEILLPGIPVAMERIKRFCRLAGRAEESMFEIVKEDPVKNHYFKPRIEVEPIATIVSDSDGQKWTSGLVIKNPFYSKTISPPESASFGEPFRLLREQDIMVCALRSWHRFGDRMPRYELVLAEGCWVAHYAALWMVCDWSV